MRYKVIETLVQEPNVVRCSDENGEEHYIDFITLAPSPKPTPQALVGKTIECDRLVAYIEIAIRWKEASDAGGVEDGAPAAR